MNFRYSLDQIPHNSVREHISLSSDKNLEVDTLKYGLNYKLNITKGKIDFLELVTNGEEWNGKFKFFRFIDGSSSFTPQMD